MLSGVSLLAVSNVNNPAGLMGLPYVTWSAHFFVTHIQTEKIISWNGPTVHVCCFMLARASTKTSVSRITQIIYNNINQITFYFAEEGPGRGSKDINKECNVSCLYFFFFYFLLMEAMVGKITINLKRTALK
jgi:hypothetical protein